MPKPNNPKGLRSFLGMVNYCDCCTPGLASKCACLNDLLHKDAKWKWTKKHSQAVDTIKKSLTFTESLNHYDPHFHLWCKFCWYRRSYLSHLTWRNREGGGICFPQIKSSCEEACSNTVRSPIHCLWSPKVLPVQHLLGRKFCLLTDHKPLLTVFRTYVYTLLMMSLILMNHQDSVKLSNWKPSQQYPLHGSCCIISDSKEVGMSNKYHMSHFSVFHFSFKICVLFIAFLMMVI